MSDLEIIVVDDGSEDATNTIVKQMPDSRIHYLCQKNAGPASARNTGIEAATGDYIGFVDSDDFVSPVMYEKLYDLAVRYNADIVNASYVQWTKWLRIMP